MSRYSKMSERIEKLNIFQAAATLIAAASAAPEASYGYGIGIYNPHATSGELIEVGGTTVPDTTASVKAAAADHLAAKTLYSGYGGYGYGGYGKETLA